MCLMFLFYVTASGRSVSRYMNIVNFIPIAIIVTECNKRGEVRMVYYNFLIIRESTKMTESATEMVDSSDSEASWEYQANII